MNRLLRLILCLGAQAILPWALAAAPTTLTVEVDNSYERVSTATGRVFVDVDGDGVYNAAKDRVAQSIVVSDGSSFALTAADGTYQLPLRRSSQHVWVCVPSDCDTPRFYAEVDSARGGRVDFPLVQREMSTTSTYVAHLSDVDIAADADREELVKLFDQIESSQPAPALVVLTGDSVRTGRSAALFSLFKSAIEGTSLTVVTTAGDLDTSNGSYLEYVDAMGPLWFSRDVGNYHLMFVPSLVSGKLEEELEDWMEADRQMAGGRKVIVFQHHQPKLNSSVMDWEELTAVGYGHWRANRLENSSKGAALISQSPALMGGLDYSPAGYRLWELGPSAITTAFHAFEDARKDCSVVYPSNLLLGPQRILANVRDTRGIVSEVRYRAINSANQIVSQGNLKQVGPVTWAAPMNLAGQQGPVQLRVRATNEKGQQWEGSSNTNVLPQSPSPVQPSTDWTQFMGSAQRTGRAPALAPPLQLVWASPTHGTGSVGSPVVYKGNIAVPVADLDNLMTQGVMGFDAVTGRQTGFAKADSSVLHSAAVVEDAMDGPGNAIAVTITGKMITFGMSSIGVQSEGDLSSTGDHRWVISSPAVQGTMAVIGNSGSLLALNTAVGERRWTSKITETDWMPSFHSPTLAGPVLIHGGVGLRGKNGSISVYGLDTQNGRMLWEVPGPGCAGSVAVRGGMGWFVDVSGKLNSINGDTGRLLSQLDIGAGYTASTPAIGVNRIVVTTSRGKVVGINPATMNVDWTWETGPSKWKMAPLHKQDDTVFTSPVIAGEYVYFGGSDGQLVALRVGDGQLVWKHELTTPILSTPAISGNALYVTGWDGNVYCFAAVNAQNRGAAN